MIRLGKVMKPIPQEYKIHGLPEDSWNRVPAHLNECRYRLAERLVKIESANPGTIRFHVNPSTVDFYVAMLKRAGIGKPFFSRSDQFLMDQFVRSEVAAALLLLMSFLYTRTGSKCHVWMGSGNYAGWEGGLTISRFDAEDKKHFLFMINVENCKHQIADLLDEIDPNDL
jgi:hypothetical protein